MLTYFDFYGIIEVLILVTSHVNYSFFDMYPELSVYLNMGSFHQSIIDVLHYESRFI